MAKGILGLHQTVATCNWGTPEFIDLGADSIFDELDLPGLLDLHFPVGRLNDPNRRGNLQENWGFAGGQCISAPDDTELLLAYNGTSLPRLLSGTMDESGSLNPWVKRVLEVGTVLGQKMGIDYCQEGFLSSNPEFAGHFKLIDDMFRNVGPNRSKINFPAFTLAAFELKDGERVKRHGDLENDPRLSGCLILSEIIYRNGSWWRVCLIFYTRKAVTDALVRVAAVSDFTNPCTKFLDSLQEIDSYRRPGCDAKEYFLDGVGAEGCFFTWDIEKKELVNIALRSKASCDKQGNFYSPLVSSILSLALTKGIQKGTDLFEIVSVVGSMCGLYTLCTSLLFMQDNWDRNTSSSLPGGLFEFVIETIKLFAGTASGGPGPRCMNFLNKDVPVRDVRRNCYKLRALANHFNRTVRQAAPAPREMTMKQARKTVHDEIYRLSKEMRFCGVFSVHHMKDTLALLGVLPSFFLDYAVLCSSVTQNQKDNVGLKMKAYLDNRDAQEYGAQKKKPSAFTQKKSKMAVVLSSCTRLLRQQTGIPALTEAIAENILCESRRGCAAYDFWTPGASLYRRHDSGQWHRITPVLPNNLVDESTSTDAILAGQVQFVTEDASVVAGKCLNHDKISTTDATVASAAWDPFVEEDPDAMDEKISIGRKRDIREPKYFQGFIPREMFDEYPGLIEKTKLAMIPRGGPFERHSVHLQRLNSLEQLKELAFSVVSTGGVSYKKKKSSNKRVKLQPDPSKQTTSVQTQPFPILDPLPTKPVQPQQEFGSPQTPIPRIQTMVPVRPQPFPSPYPHPTKHVQPQQEFASPQPIPIRQSSPQPQPIPIQHSSPHPHIPSKQPIVTVSPQAKPLQVDLKFRKCSYRVDSVAGMEYKVYLTKMQLDGTITTDFLGFVTPDQLSAVKPLPANLPNLITSALKSSVKDKSSVENVKISRLQTKRSKKPPNANFRHREVEGQCYCRLIIKQVKLNSIDIGTVGICMLRDTIAKALGGRDIEGHWFFISKEEAVRWLALVAVCSFGSVAMYTKLCLSLREKTAGPVHAALYKPSVGSVSYCLIAGENTEGVGILGLGFPVKVTSKNGKKTAGGLDDSKKMMFVRLL